MVVATAPCDVAAALLATSADDDECAAISMLTTWLDCEDASCAAGANVPVCDVVAESLAIMSSKSARVCKSIVGGLVATAAGEVGAV